MDFPEVFFAIIMGLFVGLLMSAFSGAVLMLALGAVLGQYGIVGPGYFVCWLLAFALSFVTANVSS